MGEIILIPFGSNTLKTLCEEIATSFPDMSHITVLTTHRRPKVYIFKYLWEMLKKPFIPPRVITFDDLILEWGLELENPSRRLINDLDQAWVLYKALKEIEGSIYSDISRDWSTFLPWGLKIGAIVEELEKEMVERPKDIPFPEGIPNELNEILEHFSRLYERYSSIMDDLLLTTKGRRQRFVAENIEKITIDNPFYILGFYALTASENKILRYIYESGGKIYWEGDPENLPALYKRWKESWGISNIKVLGEKKKEISIKIYSACDLHSELEKVRELIPSEIKEPTDFAIVLPDPYPLFPVLHTIPENLEINVTIGYPLERTNLYRFMLCLVNAIKTMDENGRFHTKELLDLLRHPYSKLTFGIDPSRHQLPSPDIPFYHLEDLKWLPPDVIRKLHIYTERLSNADTLKKGIHAFDSILEEIPLDAVGFEAEFILCLRKEVFPSLESALFSSEAMERNSILSIILSYIKNVKIPFEGEPLKGLQVIGLLETRLIDFKKVAVIDVNEGILPSLEDVDPLLPEPIKRAIGLPERERREEIIRYHFERLIRSSQEAHILYQERIYGSGGLDQKKIRSRFIEGIIWEMEKERRELMEEKLVERIPTGVIALKSEYKGLERDEFVENAISSVVRNQLSYSHFNTYITCPIKFFFSYGISLEPHTQITDDLEGKEIGNIVHEILEDYFREFKGKIYRKEYFRRDRLHEIISKALEKHPILRAYPWKRLLFERVIKHRLESYLLSHPYVTIIKELEVEKNINLNTDGENLRIVSKMDRIDERNGEFLILDYKTGWMDTKKIRISDIATFEPSGDYSPEELKFIKDTYGDLQLPIYILTFTEGKKDMIKKTKAAYVPLFKMGSREEEVEFYPFVAESLDEYTTFFGECIPKILAYLLKHMLFSDVLYPAVDPRYCRSCGYKLICSFSRF